jgi:hypothetical protein
MIEGIERKIIHGCLDCPCLNLKDGGIFKDCSLGFKDFAHCGLNLITCKKTHYIKNS